MSTRSSSRLLQGTCASLAKTKRVQEPEVQGIKHNERPSRLTNPKTPKLSTRTRTRVRPMLSQTSKELLEIQKAKEAIKKARQKTARYREATQMVPTKSKRKNTHDKENVIQPAFQMVSACQTFQLQIQI